jgi:hypothetical protein
MIAAGVKFYLTEESLLAAQFPGTNGAVMATNQSFLNEANRIFVKNNRTDLLLTTRNADPLIAYACALIPPDEVRPYAVRCHRVDEFNVFLDMANGTDVLHISGEAGIPRVEIIKECPVLFNRHEQQPLPTVSQEELNIAVDKAHKGFVLDNIPWQANRKLWGQWEVSERSAQTLFSFSIHSTLCFDEHPILHFIGDSDSGKSFMGCHLIWTVEPRVCVDGSSGHRYNPNAILGEFPSDKEGLALRARKRLICGADNLNSSETYKETNVLSRLTTAATGSSVTQRKFYTQSETVEYVVCCPVLITGTHQLVHVADQHFDLLRRLYPIPVMSVQNRKKITFKKSISDKKCHKERLLEVISAAAVVLADVGDGSGYCGFHRVGSFAAVMNSLFYKLGRTWETEHFDRLEIKRFESSYRWVRDWLTSAITGNVYTVMGILLKSSSIDKPSPEKAGRILKSMQTTIERLYAVKLEHVDSFRRGDDIIKGWKVVEKHESFHSR